MVKANDVNGSVRVTDGKAVVKASDTCTRLVSDVDARAGCEPEGDVAKAGRLSEEDRRHLLTLMPKLTLIRDHVRKICRGLTTGLYLFGPGGCGKSFTVTDELKAEKAIFHLHNSSITARGLFDVLRRFPDDIHLIEDAETLVNDPKASGVLRSALDSQAKEPYPERLVTWNTYNQKGTQPLSFIFTGAIVFTANTALPDRAEYQAIKTRIPVLELALHAGEVSALMRSLAAKGFRYGEYSLDASECHEVAEFVIEHFRRMSRTPDLRLYFAACKDFVFDKSGGSDLGWRSLTLATMSEVAVLPREPAGLENKTAQRFLELAVELAQRTDLDATRRHAIWEKHTGKAWRGYYRWRTKAVGLGMLAHGD
jgi:hypothetical protein